VLQIAVTAEGVAGQLYAAALTEALVMHFLRRYAASRPPQRQGTGGLAPSKLRRTIAYIRDHLEQALSQATLAAVAQTSPAHFARQFKRATGRTPHQYVITYRIEYAKRLLAETDVPLIARSVPRWGARTKVTSRRSFGSTSPCPPKCTETPHGGSVMGGTPPSVPAARSTGGRETCHQQAARRRPHPLRTIPTLCARLSQTVLALGSTFSPNYRRGGRAPLGLGPTGHPGGDVSESSNNSFTQQTGVWL
jgi:AraC-like DNA-binding protein